ncbi:MAG: Uma2 family endonuclease [Candidatus Eremiobacteraeota bacterium]|nr:Uma2 family endonuclease [Candidatus Eremiobacteraeota bacterium]MCW5868393.1 Uma2 family endonuclease [Candidatus Eremiobacteraeota bacterium]
MTVKVQHRRFTVKEYAKMGDAGIFAPGERVELLEGKIIAVSPQNPRHARRISRLTTLFVGLFGQTHEIRVQLPLTLSKFSEPEPDFALVSFQASDDAWRHPVGADLVLEISDSTLSLDRNKKARIYAQAGIADYWILNMAKKRLEVRRAPGEEGYSNLTLLTPGQTISPLAFPDVNLQVADLLGNT